MWQGKSEAFTLTEILFRKRLGKDMTKCDV